MNGEDDKYRSRKFQLAQQSWWASTAIHAGCLILGYISLKSGLIDAEIYKSLVSSLVSSYGIQIGVILGLYGAANVAAKRLGGDQ